MPNLFIFKTMKFVIKVFLTLFVATILTLSGFLLILRIYSVPDYNQTIFVGDYPNIQQDIRIARDQYGIPDI
jgi:hypothetical protein